MLFANQWDLLGLTASSLTRFKEHIRPMDKASEKPKARRSLARRSREKQIEKLTAQLEDQPEQTRKVNDKVEMNRAAPRTVADNQ